MPGLPAARSAMRLDGWIAGALKVTHGEFLEIVVDHYELVCEAGREDWRETLQRRGIEYFGVRVRGDFKKRCEFLAKAF